VDVPLRTRFDISSPILHEFISRWSVDDNCFRSRQHSVPFKVVDVDEFCRLYILLLLYVFFLPRTSKTFSSFPFKVLDNLDALDGYNWGSAVYELIVSNLTWSPEVYNNQKNAREIYLAGCVLVLQVSGNYEK